MTQAQEDAKEKIKDIMREHFDAGVCVLRVDPSDEDKDDAERHYIWHGGSDTAVGLCARLNQHFLNSVEVADE